MNVIEQQQNSAMLFRNQLSSPVMSLQKCPLKQSHKEMTLHFFTVLGVFSFTLLGLNSGFTMPKYSFPRKICLGD